MAPFHERQAHRRRHIRRASAGTLWWNTTCPSRRRPEHPCCWGNRSTGCIGGWFSSAPHQIEPARSVCDRWRLMGMYIWQRCDHGPHRRAGRETPGLRGDAQARCAGRSSDGGSPVQIPLRQVRCTSCHHADVVPPPHCGAAPGGTSDHGYSSIAGLGSGEAEAAVGSRASSAGPPMIPVGGRSLVALVAGSVIPRNPGWSLSRRSRHNAVRLRPRRRRRPANPARLRTRISRTAGHRSRALSISRWCSEALVQSGIVAIFPSWATNRLRDGAVGRVGLGHRRHGCDNGYML
jgi:hypothetical protein